MPLTSSPKRSLRPKFLEAHNNLDLSLHELSRLGKGLVTTVMPNLSNLIMRRHVTIIGNALKYQGELDK